MPTSLSGPRGKRYRLVKRGYSMDTKDVLDFLGGLDKITP